MKTINLLLGNVEQETTMNNEIKHKAEVLINTPPVITDEKEWIRTAVEVIQAYLQEREWISVENRLPDALEFGQYETYLVATERGGVFQCSWLFNGWHQHHDGCSERKDVTHWMPLPEPPKETE